MPSFRSVALLAAAAISQVAKADYIIDPDSVDEATRDNWCQTEITSCPLICYQIVDGEPLTNTCDPDTLTYGCVCSDGSRPNVSEYTLTLPYFTCTEWGNQCVEGCGSNSACATSCREDNPCGAQDPQTSNETATDTATVSATASATSSEDAEDAANTNVLGESTDEGAGVALGRSYGLLFVAGALFTGFAML